MLSSRITNDKAKTIPAVMLSASKSVPSTVLKLWHYMLSFSTFWNAALPQMISEFERQHLPPRCATADQK